MSKNRQRIESRNRALQKIYDLGFKTYTRRLPIHGTFFPRGTMRNQFHLGWEHARKRHWRMMEDLNNGST